MNASPGSADGSVPMCLPRGFRALVIGASGGLGAAFVEHLSAMPDCAKVVALGRSTSPAIDYDDESSITHAAATLAGDGPFDLVVIATGLLHREGFMPEKKLGQLNYRQLEASFRINAMGPALLVAHFSALLASKRAVMAVLSAKVGSIEDNRAGGWYSYRASKAALNMLLKTAAIEMRRTHPGAVLVALHPGTVNTALSRPFRGASIGRRAADAVLDLMSVITSLQAHDSGSFIAYNGQRLPW